MVDWAWNTKLPTYNTNEQNIYTFLAPSSLFQHTSLCIPNLTRRFLFSLFLHNTPLIYRVQCLLHC